jgi:hypothetical protein
VPKCLARSSPSPAGYARTNSPAGSCFTLSQEPPLIGDVRCVPSRMSQPTRKARTPPEVPPDQTSAGFFISYAAVPRNLRCADGLDYSASGSLLLWCSRLLWAALVLVVLE